MGLIRQLAWVPAGIAAAVAVPVQAQTLGDVEKRLDRLESAVKHVPKAKPVVDERKDDSQKQGLLALEGRVSLLEKTIASLTSAQEEDHKATATALEQLTRFRGDGESRIAALEERVTALSNAPKAEPVQAAPPREMTADDRFLEALEFTRQGAWPKAEFAFDTFLANNPQHPRAIEASYWLGESFLREGKPAQAAKIFLDIYQKHGDSPVVVDTLFGLGEALADLGPDSTAQACSVYDQIDSDYKDKLGSEQRNLLLDRRLHLGCAK